ncbi:desulfoferrodoxin [Clostridium fermenticellae]|uniref:Desulfoferrodoxin n=1 Tax=Clostridium fermenticellae TaxID=2068654 RepID=A0A386H513_9CLOT|nr:desulfoferrodoxin [Clostridium fermenticellae]AYD40841.1 desulfoferrodoxin [Clostridium fermenticellae]
MTEIKQIYKCEVCGNVIEVVHQGKGTLICCGREMKLMDENTVDASHEKHVPVIEKIQDGVYVKVGEQEHSMEDGHYIEWIEVHTPNKICRKYLRPNEKPEAIFKVDSEVLCAREYCNVHGLWRK